jgi:hypothetical protein
VDRGRLVLVDLLGRVDALLVDEDAHAQVERSLLLGGVLRPLRPQMKRAVSCPPLPPSP